MFRSNNQLPAEDDDSADAENETADGDREPGRPASGHPVNASIARRDGEARHSLSPDRNPQGQLSNEALHTEAAHAGAEDADDWKHHEDWEGQVELLTSTSLCSSGDVTGVSHVGCAQARATSALRVDLPLRLALFFLVAVGFTRAACVATPWLR